jgi:hypothetical protein
LDKRTFELYRQLREHGYSHKVIYHVLKIYEQRDIFQKMETISRK